MVHKLWHHSLDHKPKRYPNVTFGEQICGPFCFRLMKTGLRISGLTFLTGLFGVEFEYTWTLDLHCPYLGQVTSVTDKINRYRSKSVLGPLHLEFFWPNEPKSQNETWFNGPEVQGPN